MAPRPSLAEVSPFAEERILALDCAALSAPRGPIPVEGTTHLTFAELDGARLAGLAPSVVVFALFGANDALTVIEHLQDLGYGGRLVVLAPALPRPRLVEDELRAAGPGRRLTLLTP